MPPNCEMRIDVAGEALPPVAAVSRMPYTMDSANVHTPDTRNTSRKSCFDNASRACGAALRRSLSAAPPSLSAGSVRCALPRHSAEAPSSTAYAARETTSGANSNSMFAAMPPNDMMPNAMATRRDE